METYADVHSSFIGNSSILERAQMFFNKQLVNKQMSLHEKLHSNKQEQTIDTWNNLDESPENYTDRRKANPKDFILPYNYTTNGGISPM